MTFIRIASPYKEIVQCVTLNGRRFYVTPAQKHYPSITEVLGSMPKPALDRWVARLGVEAAEKEKNRASVRGNDLHQMCELYLNNNDPAAFLEHFPKGRMMFNLLRRKLDKIQNIQLQETALYSDRLGLAGRVDLIAEYDGTLSVVDFKGSTKMKQAKYIKNYFMQASGYAYMYWERTGILIKQIVVLVACEELCVQTFVENPKDHLKDLYDIVKLYRTLPLNC